MKNQSQPGLRILLVEDQQALACNIIDYLTAAGHQLDYTATGVLALQLAKQHSYDLVPVSYTHLTLPTNREV